MVAAIGVDRSEDTERTGHGDLMLECMAAQGCVVRLDIDAHFLFKAETLQKAIDRLRIEIILMLGRLMGLGLDQNRALEADAILVIDNKVQEPAEILLFNADLRVEN